MPIQKLFIIVAFAAVIYNLGAALFHMMTDKSGDGRMAKSLTWRIGLSVGLIALVVLGIFTGVVEPHGVHVGH